MTRIEFCSVNKTYPGGVQALVELSWVAEPGRWFLILGPSGCGKTTLLRLIAGLEQPSCGTLLLDGIDARTLQPHQRRVALVPQESALYPNRTVEQNLTFGCSPQASHLAQVIEALGIGSWLRKLPGQLSGGERQRVALARALVRRPRILLLDEPLAQIDAPTRAEIRARLPLLVGAPPPTIVHVTHDQDEAIDLADGVVLLQGGRLQQSGSVADLLQNPRTPLVDAFLRRSSPAIPRPGSTDDATTPPDGAWHH
jgi:ABC-type sugar transport system ATPase subunit